MLSGNVVIITGASSGFGKDAALEFAKEGCRVVLAARRLEKLENLAKEIQEKGGEALVVQTDISKQAEINKLTRIVKKLYGRVDILFNNAGFGKLDWLEVLDPEGDIDTQIDINLRGVIQFTHAILPLMIANKSGVIINMSSMAGWIAPPLFSVYAATKFGLRGFTEALRRELRPLGIKVCGIYPGGATTEFGQHTGNSKLRQDIKTPKRLSMTSAFVGKKVVWLAKHPRRSLILPWWMGFAIWMDSHVKWLVDGVINMAVKKYHH